MSIKYFSAFAGIGGFDLGIDRTIQDAECIGISEVDKHAIKIYEKHYPDRTNYGDIRKIKTKDLPDFDLFCGGFPCQDVSIAGKRKGLCGARSGLFFEIIRIVRKKQPRYILLENVKGLLSSNKGWDFARILIELGDAGYSVEWAVYNSKNFGVPQNRERVFIVGHLGRDCGSKIFPLGEGTGNFDESGEQPERELVSNAIDSNYYKGPDGKRQLVMIGHTRDKKGNASYHQVDFAGALKSPSGNQCNYLVPGQMIQITKKSTADAQRIYDSSGIARTIKGTHGGVGAKTGLYCISSQPRCGDPAKGGTGLLTSEDSCFTLNRNPHIICDSGLSRKKQVRTEIMPPLRANTGAGHNNIVGSVRRLTPLEAERLQGFPEMWTAMGSDGKPISDTQRYKMLGNAVTVNVIEAIMAAIREKW